MNEQSKLKKYTAWVISGLLTAGFLITGGFKIAGAEQMVMSFQKWGFPLIFLYLVGLSEIVLAIGLWVPRVSGIAALGLTGLMVGGAGIHIWADELNAIGPAIVMGTLSATVFWIRLPQTRDLYLQYRKSAPGKPKRPSLT